MRTSSIGDGGIPALKSKKLYTVLPPPEAYSGGAQLPVVGPAPESTSKGSDPESKQSIYHHTVVY